MRRNYKMELINKNTKYHESRIAWAEKTYEDPSLLPHRYVFILTNRCNLKCSFCFQEKNRIAGSMTTLEWKNLIDQLPNYAHVTLTGGEPFIFKGFREVFLKVTEKLTCNIISNGLLLNEDLIDLLLERKNFEVLSISFDNIGNTLRDVPTEKWNRTEEMLKLFIKKRNDKEASQLLDMKTVILDENSKDLFEIYKYCKEVLKADTHSFMFLKGHPIQHSDIMFPLDAINSLSEAHIYADLDLIRNQLEMVRAYNIKNGVYSYVHPKFINLNSTTPLTPKDFQVINEKDHIPELFQNCKAPWASVHINVDGNLFPCMAINTGNVKKTSLSSIIHGKVFSEFKEEIRSCGTISGCNRCGYLLKKTT